MKAMREEKRCEQIAKIHIQCIAQAVPGIFCHPLLRPRCRSIRIRKKMHPIAGRRRERGPWMMREMKNH
jgi:hypothetical protein